jgi:hypothetical protein
MTVLPDHKIAPSRVRRWPRLLSRWLLSLVIICGAPFYFAAELSSSAYTASSPRSILVRLHEKPSPLRWPAAHRGAPGYAPENSVPAIRGAAQAGVPLIEVDMRCNADGTLFLYHDSYLDREKVVGPRALIGRRVASLSDYELGLVQYLGASAAGMATYAQTLEANQAVSNGLAIGC